MASDAQNAANFANAQHSTGPTTEEGKAASARNSLKHGLTAANTVLLPGEDEAAYIRLCEGARLYWKPAGDQEIALVQNLADTQWRIERCARLEAAALSGDVPDFKIFDTISKHEARLRRSHSRSLSEIRDLIAARIARDEEEMRKAKTIRRCDKMEGRSSDFQALGFVFSIEEIDAAIKRELTYLRANHVVYKGRNAA